jgi:hypothetical protein
MQPSSNIAFKEWAVVVDALGRGEQILILRKGGIREHRGQFQPEHAEFWLYPTQYHEAERSIIPSKRPALREIAASTLPDTVNIEFYAVADPVLHIADATSIGRLQGRHIWTEQVLRERFEFGRDRGLYAMIVRVYRRREPVRLPVRASYGGCKSWLELDRALTVEGLTPVLSDAEFDSRRDEICELISDHALARH